MMRRAVLQRRSLFIAAGHSDTDPGAVAHGHTEAGIVLDFRDLLADYLRERVVFDKDGARGVNLPLSDAIGAATSHDIAVEFHTNAFTSPSARGVETLSRAQHYPLGNALCAAIAETLGIPNRGAKGEASGQHSRLGFISRGGGVICELFFITSREDLDAYFTRREQLAAAVGDVLIAAASEPKEHAA